MKFFTTSILLMGFCLLSAQAQEVDLQSLFQRQYDAEMEALVVDTEVWRVDSTYCWTNDALAGTEVPTVRSYNLEFSEYSGQILREERQQFTEGNWINSLRKQYIYDDNDNIEETIDETWLAQESNWEFTDKNLFNFNSSANDFDDIISQNWDNGTWNNRSQTINTFHPTHFKVTQSDNYLWEDNAWVLDNRFYFSVNINSLLTQGVLFQKRNESGVLANLSRTFIYYDEMGNDTLTTYELNNGAWFFTSRIQKEFENGRDILRTEQAYDAAEMTWTNTTQTQTEYTPSGEQALVTVSSWNTQENAFVPSYRTAYSYDAADNLTEFSTDLFQDGTWVYNGRCQIYWSEYEVVVDPGGGTSTTDVILHDCKIANPLAAGSSFSCSDWDIEGKGSMEIYDLSGRMLSSQIVNNQANIEVKSGLNTGFYTFVLRDARGMVWRKKVVVE